MKNWRSPAIAGIADCKAFHNDDARLPDFSPPGMCGMAHVERSPENLMQ
jgi:hypothetical protein